MSGGPHLFFCSAPWERADGWGVPFLFPPLGLQLALSVRDRSGGGPLPSSPASLVPHAGSMRCRFSSPSSGYLMSWSPVAPWPAALPGSPASAWSTAVLVGASKLYSRRASTPCSGLAPLVLAVFLDRVPALTSSAVVPCCGRGGAAVHGLPIKLLSPPPSPCALVARVVGGFRPLLAPVRLRLVCPRVWWSLREFVPPRQVGYSGGVGALWLLDPPRPLPGGTPVGFLPLRRPCAPPPPPCPPLQGTRGSLWRPCGPRRRPALPKFFWTIFPACLRISPYVPASPHSIPTLPTRRRPRGGAFLVSPPPAIASPCGRSAPLSRVPRAVAVLVSLSHIVSPAVVASSPVSDPSVSSESDPLQFALSSLLPPWLAPLVW